MTSRRSDPSQLELKILNNNYMTSRRSDPSQLELKILNKNGNKKQNQLGQTILHEIDEFDAPYPCLNIICSPRVYQQKIQNTRIPLSKYKEKIYASNCKKSHQAPLVDINFLTKFGESDGMIYNLRDVNKHQQGHNKLGPVKILICICMYNQTRGAIQLTLEGIYQNLKHFRDAGYSPNDVVVVLLQDGILKLVKDRQKRLLVGGKSSMVTFYEDMDRKQGKHKCEIKQRINLVLDEIDNYNRKGMSNYVTSNIDFPPSIQKNVGLLYQNLWYPSKTYVQGTKQFQGQNSQKLRILTCFKHTNGTKLSSHLWFFQGFCRHIKPQYCVLLDVGTKPDPTGLVNLIRGFQNKQIGGVTGFMSVDSQFESLEGGDKDQQTKGWMENNLYSVQKAQQYEYIISHFLDKNSQSALGFLHVLPGAWSAYRYKALIKSDQYQPNLLEKSYFKMILNPNLEERDYMEANMYLAEDRILSLGIYCQMEKNYLLKYIPNAIAYTDPMKTHQNLMSQRRRWINSSLFAFLYVFRNYYFNVMQSKHNFVRRYITLNIAMVIALLSFLNTYITPSIYFFILYSTIINIQGYSSITQQIAKTFSFFYVLTFLISVGGGLTGKNWMKKAHYISYILSFFTVLMTGLVLYNIIVIYLRISAGSLDRSNFVTMSLIVMLGINIGFGAIIIVMHICTHPLFVWKLFLDTASYMAYQGAYSQVMVSHSFCNVDDVSWGTKGSSAAHGKKKYNTDKVFFVSSWLFYNALLSAIFIYVDIIVPVRTNSGSGSILIGIALYGSTFLLIKSVFAVYYHFKWNLYEKCKCFTDKEEQRRRRQSADIDKYWKQHSNRWKTQLSLKKSFN